MKNITIIFNHPPHGSALGREALDAALALSDINKIAIFFIGDGVFHLLRNQQPNKILTRDYISTLKMLALYDITNIYACQEALAERHLLEQQWIIETKVEVETEAKVTVISKQTITDILAQQDTILQF